MTQGISSGNEHFSSAVANGPSVWATTPNGRNRLVAALFALVLGGLGIHKFYLGRVGLGLLYLLFCWTFIPTIIGFIEGIVLLASGEAEFLRKYGTN
jgi:TM2 domain-containing membrane protein YozV